MYVFDNIVPKNILDPIIHKQNTGNNDWIFNRSDNNQDMYYTKYIYGKNYSRYENLTDIKNQFSMNEVKVLWNWFHNITNIPLNSLESCYINGLTYGTEAFAHIDIINGEQACTCIFYLNPDWHSQWGGETVFYSGTYTPDYNDEWYYSHDIIKSVLPKNNRLLVFDGYVPHSVRPLSKLFKGMRQTLMFKIRNTSSKYVKELLCNYNKGHIAL